MQKAIKIVQIIMASSYIILPRPLIMQFKCGFERPTNAKSSLAQSVKHLARVWAPPGSNPLVSINLDLPICIWYNSFICWRVNWLCEVVFNLPADSQGWVIIDTQVGCLTRVGGFGFT